MNDTTTTNSNNKIPEYHNLGGIPKQPLPNSTPLLTVEPEPENPRRIMQMKYPLRTITGILVLLVTVLAVPVTVYLSQQPTSVFLQADTPRPIPTFPESPTPTPTASPDFTSESR